MEEIRNEFARIFGLGIEWWWSWGRGVSADGMDREKHDLLPDLKRYLSLALAGMVAVVAYAAGVAMGYEPTPEDVRGWIEAVFSVIAVAVMSSQAMHGFVRLRAKRV